MRGSKVPAVVRTRVWRDSSERGYSVPFERVKRVEGWKQKREFNKVTKPSFS
jgi:hypothetical protein